MTSRSHKSRPTTAWATTARATATSLLAALVATTGSAQPPAGTPAKTTWQPPGGTAPAKTSWQPFPMDQLTAPPLVSLPSAGLPPAVPAPPASVPPVAPTAPVVPSIGTRVVVFQKPAGDDRPTAARDDKDKEKDKDKDKSAEKEPTPALPKGSSPTAPDPKPIEIRLLDDKQLEADLIRIQNAKQVEQYNRNPPEDKKDKPVPIGEAQLPPSAEVRKQLLASLPPTAPRSTFGAPPSTVLIEPGFVVHRRLYFEEKNSERYGWNLGMAQPFISAGYFYKDLLLYPFKLGSNRDERYDTSAGKAMPGSPVPYLLYPPEITFGGLVIGSTVVVGTVFLLP